MSNRHFAVPAIAAGALVLAAFVSPPAAADAVEDFYKGKSMRMIIPTSPGAGYDVYARFMSRHLGKFIPGHPSFVNQNMPGAGHVRAGQYMAKAAPRDGSVIGTINQGMPFSQISTPKQVPFDTAKFLWIGNPIEINNVLQLWHDTGVKSLKDMQEREIVVGATGATATSGLYPRAMNNILGTKLKLIVGFKGGAEMNLAMERGEISGRGSNSWASIKGVTPQHLAENKLIIPVQMGLKKEKDLPNVPMLWEWGRNPAETRVLRMLSALPSIGRPLFTTEGVPADRVKALRKAFDEAVKSRALLDEAARSKIDINPVSGEEVQKIVEEIVSAPDDLKLLAAAAVTKGAIFDCKALVKDAKYCAPAKKKKKKKSS